MIGLIYGQKHNAGHKSVIAVQHARYNNQGLLQREVGGPANQHAQLTQALKPRFNWNACRIDFLARFILQSLPACFDLLLDRTEHHFGKTSVNLLTLTACIGRVCIPITWDHLGKTGNSNTKQRTNLLGALLRVMQPTRVQALIANGEFMGATWLTWLKNQRVPFVIRIRAHTIAQFGSFKDRADRLRSKLLIGECLVFSTACKLLCVRGYFSTTRLAGDALVVFDRRSEPRFKWVSRLTETSNIK
jgi:hypothetical protein